MGIRVISLATDLFIRLLSPPQRLCHSVAPCLGPRQRSTLAGGHHGIPGHCRPRPRCYPLRDGASSSLQPLDAWVVPPHHVWKSRHLNFGRQTAHRAHPWSPHWRPPRYTPPPPPTTSLLHPERWYFFVSSASRCVGGSTPSCLEVPTPQFRPPDRPSRPTVEPPLA